MARAKLLSRLLLHSPQKTTLMLKNKKRQAKGRGIKGNNSHHNNSGNKDAEENRYCLGRTHTAQEMNTRESIYIGITSGRVVVFVGTM